MTYNIEYIYAGGKHRGTYIGDLKQIKDQLRKEGKTVLRAKKKVLPGLNRVKRADIVAAFTALGDLLTSGEQVSRSIGAVADSLDSTSALRPVLTQIGEQILAGRTFAQAFDSYTYIFGSTVVAMIAAGEGSGKVGASFLAAAGYVQQMGEVKQEVVKRLIYPATVLVITMLGIVFNSVFVMPMLSKNELFKGATTTATAINMAIMQGASKVVPAAILLVLLAAAGIAVMFKYEQEKAERILARIPWIKSLIFSRAYYIGFSSLANLTGTGVRLGTALSIITDSAKLILVKKEFADASAAVKEGSRFTKGLKSLTPVERTMLDTAMNSTRQQANFDAISRRFYSAYIDRVRSIGPKIYGVAVLLVAMVFIMLFSVVMLPYFKSLGNIGKI